VGAVDGGAALMNHESFLVLFKKEREALLFAKRSKNSHSQPGKHRSIMTAEHERERR
jgi:hypothetical protein